jgi:hypothetical protein
MPGIKQRVFVPLCNQSLETLVPPGHFYHHLEATLDLHFVRDLVRTTYKARWPIEPSRRPATPAS